DWARSPRRRSSATSVPARWARCAVCRRCAPPRPPPDAVGSSRHDVAMANPPGPLLDEVRAWQAVDPDPQTRAELDGLIAAGDTDALAERFGGRLQFGTAGLRAALGAGPMRMNRVVVRRAAWGLVRYLLETDPAATERGLVIGFDAR